MAALQRVRVAASALCVRPWTGARRFARLSQLSRQIWHIERLVGRYDRPLRRKLAAALQREFDSVDRGAEPARAAGHGAAAAQPATGPAALRSEGTAVAWQRVRSGNPEVQVCGIALWLARVYRELVDQDDASARGIVRRIIRISRETKEIRHQGGEAAGADGRLPRDRFLAGI